MTTMTTPEQFTLESQNLGCLPIVNFFLARMGVADHLRTYLPPGDARLRLTPAAVVEQVVRNLVVGHRPVYALGEWRRPMTLACSASRSVTPRCSTTTGVGRTLD